MENLVQAFCNRVFLTLLLIGMVITHTQAEIGNGTLEHTDFTDAEAFVSTKHSSTEIGNSVSFSLECLAYYYHLTGQEDIAASIQWNFLYGWDDQGNVKPTDPYKELMTMLHRSHVSKDPSKRMMPRENGVPQRLLDLMDELKAAPQQTPVAEVIVKYLDREFVQPHKAKILETEVVKSSSDSF